MFENIKADYNIVLGIQKLRGNLPMPSSISWVKGHQDHYLDRDELTLAAKGNIHTDEVFTAIHMMNIDEVGQFPEWVPGTPMALLHNGRFISKCIDTYVRTAATAPRAQTYLINKSNRCDTDLPTKWADEIFDDVDW